METWRETWRDGFSKVLPTDGLKALAGALERDDPRLIQNATTTPPPLMCVQDWPVEAACALGWCGWMGGENPDCTTVGDTEEVFAKACFECDQILHEAAACRHFLNWFDDTPRDEMRRELLAEVRRTLEEREEMAATADRLIASV